MVRQLLVSALAAALAGPSLGGVVFASDNSASEHACKIFNYAVMSGSASFPDGWPPRVFSPWALLRKIQSKKTPILTGSQVASICRALERGRIREGYWAARKHSGRANALSRETPAKDG